MKKGVLRHKDGGKHNEIGGKRPRLVVCVVEEREKLCQQKHNGGNNNTTENRESDHLIIRIPRLFHFTRAEKLSDNDSHGFAQRNKHDVKYIVDRVGYIECGDHV